MLIGCDKSVINVAHLIFNKGEGVVLIIFVEFYTNSLGKGVVLKM